MAAVETAGSAVKADQIVIRKLEGIDELRTAVALQKEVWGFSDAELIPLRMFVVAQKIGGQTVGAFDDGEMVGFLLAIPGNRHGHLYLHSHMMGVRDAYRNYGLGRRLKLFQRQDAIERGIELIEWTFDPLEIKNAFLNLERLGAIARRYNINQYGTTSSPLHGGLPSDRLMAEWWVNSKRAQLVAAGEKHPPVNVETRIRIPAEIYDWKSRAETRDRARQVLERTRAAFLDGFGKGLAALGYERDAEGNGTFLLGKWEEDFSYSK